MPGTCSSCFTSAKGPCAVRQVTIRAANAGPTPGRHWSSSLVAVFKERPVHGGVSGSGPGGRGKIGGGGAGPDPPPPAPRPPKDAVLSNPPPGGGPVPA